MTLRNSFRLGRILGIEVALHYSWFIIFALVFWALGSQVFPSWYPDMTSPIYYGMAAATTVLFFGSVLAHEIMHSVVARRRGLPVSGITLFIFGGVSNIAREPDDPAMELAVAFAGPASSLLLGGLFLGLWAIGRALSVPTGFVGVALYLAFINIVLAIFNLVPGFPLDGGRLLRALIWKRTNDLTRATRVASVIGTGIGFLIVAYGIYLFIVGYVASGLWLVLIGWFLEQMSVHGYKETVIRQSLLGVRVSQLMTPEPVRIPAETNLEEAVDGYFLRFNHSAFPVYGNGELRGLLTWRRAKEVPRSKWAETGVAEVMLPLAPEIVTSPQAEMNEVLALEAMRQHGRMLVLEAGKLAGIISRSDVSEFLQRHARDLSALDR
ncbi:MAG: site-2 protease family protein [Candidatus Geothermincolia bacterium]